MTTRVDLSPDIQARTPGLVALCRTLHQHPELAPHDPQAAAKV